MHYVYWRNNVFFCAEISIFSYVFKYRALYDYRQIIICLSVFVRSRILTCIKYMHYSFHENNVYNLCVYFRELDSRKALPENGNGIVGIMYVNTYSRTQLYLVFNIQEFTTTTCFGPVM